MNYNTKLRLAKLQRRIAQQSESRDRIVAEYTDRIAALQLQIDDIEEQEKRAAE